MAKNLERSYDGIIIGAGHHGLILGTYLAKAGSRSCWWSAVSNTAAGCTTREVTEPGFYHNLHSINHFHIIANALVRRPRACATASPTSRRATSSARRIATAARWCSDAISRRRSPTSRASQRRTPRRSASGTRAPRQITRDDFAAGALQPSRCRRPSAKRLLAAPRSAATFSP